MLLIMGNFVFSQVGIGTSMPHASSDLDLGATDKALYLNRVANPQNDIANPQSGMMLYDTTEHCVKVFDGNPAKWSSCLGVKIGTITSLTCTSAVFNPSDATKGIPYTGTLTISYTGGNGGVYPAQSFMANNMTFTLASGNFATGTGNLVFNIAGTPTSSGTFSVNVTVAGQTCTGAGALIIDVGN